MGGSQYEPESPISHSIFPPHFGQGSFFLSMFVPFCFSVLAEVSRKFAPVDFDRVISEFIEVQRCLFNIRSARCANALPPPRSFFADYVDPAPYLVLS